MLGSIDFEIMICVVVCCIYGELFVGWLGSWIVEMVGSWVIVMVLMGLYLWWLCGRGIVGVVWLWFGWGR